MANDVNIRFGASGETEFKNAVKGVDSQIKNLKSELSLAVSEMGRMDDAEASTSRQMDILQRTAEATQSKVAILTDQYQKQRDKLEDLGQALQKAIDENGEGSAEAIKAEAAYNRQATAVNDLGTKLNKAQTDLNATKGQMDNLTRGTDEASDAMEEAGQKALTLGDVLKANIASEVIIAGVKKLASGLKDLAFGAAKSADKISTLSKQTGLSTDTLQEYAYMEELVDVSLETITGSITKLTRNMSSAKDGTGAAAEAFAQLGVEVTNSDGSLRSAEDVFNDVIDALGKIDNQTEADALAMNLFGKSAQQLNPLIQAGSETLAEYAKEAHDVGYVMSSEVLEANSKVDDAQQRLNKSTEAFKNELGSALAPVVLELVEDLSSLLSWLMDNSDFITGTAIPAVTGITAAFVAYKAALIAMKVIETVTKATEGMTLAQAALNTILNMNPILIVVTALAALAAALITAYKTNDEFRAKVDAAFSGLKDGFEDVKKWFEDAVAFIKDLPQRALQWGKDMIDNFVQGIRSYFSKVESASRDAAAIVNDYIGFSEPKKGPLSDFHTYGPDMMDLYARGMYSGLPELERAAEAAAGIMAGAAVPGATLMEAGAAVGGAVASSIATAGAGAPVVLQVVMDRKVIAEAIYNDLGAIAKRKGASFA